MPVAWRFASQYHLVSKGTSCLLAEISPVLTPAFHAVRVSTSRGPVNDCCASQTREAGGAIELRQSAARELSPLSISSSLLFILHLYTIEIDD